MLPELQLVKQLVSLIFKNKEYLELSNKFQINHLSEV